LGTANRVLPFSASCSAAMLMRPASCGSRATVVPAAFACSVK